MAKTGMKTLTSQSYRKVENCPTPPGFSFGATIYEGEPIFSLGVIDNDQTGHFIHFNINRMVDCIRAMQSMIDNVASNDR